MPQNISASEFLGLYQQGKPLTLVDVRTPAEFQGQHVTFAKNIPLDKIDVGLVREKFSGATDGQVYVICQAGKRSEMACDKLSAQGMTNVISVAGGTTACVTAGLPVVNGKKVISLERQVRIAAGSLVLIGIILSYALSNPYFIGISAFVGAGLVFAGITDTCGMGMMLAKMPWNQVAKTSETQSVTGTTCSKI